MLRARKHGVLTPVVYLVEHEASAVYMERIAGCSVKAALLQGKLGEQGAAARVSHAVGMRMYMLQAMIWPSTPQGRPTSRWGVRVVSKESQRQRNVIRFTEAPAQ